MNFLYNDLYTFYLPLKVNDKYDGTRPRISPEPSWTDVAETL